MRIIIDTNILFSFFRSNPVRHLIVNSSLFGLQMYVPAYAIDELEKNRNDLVKYTNVSDKQLDGIFRTLRCFIITVPVQEFESYKEQAIFISPDRKDAPFFGLALYLGASLWSNEPKLKKQSKVNVFNTQEMIEKYKKFL